MRVVRAIGLLVLLAIASEILACLLWTGPVLTRACLNADALGYVVRASLAVMIGLSAGALAASIALREMPALRRVNPVLAIGLMALAAAGFSVAAVDSLGVMSMLSQCETYAVAADDTLPAAVRTAAVSARSALHHMGFLLGATTVLLCGALLGARPRARHRDFNPSDNRGPSGPACPGTSARKLAARATGTSVCGAVPG